MALSFPPPSMLNGCTPISDGRAPASSTDVEPPLPAPAGPRYGSGGGPRGAGSRGTAHGDRETRRGADVWTRSGGRADL